jgi:hypothetical protein
MQGLQENGAVLLHPSEDAAERLTQVAVTQGLADAIRQFSAQQDTRWAAVRDRQDQFEKLVGGDLAEVLQDVANVMFRIQAFQRVVARYHPELFAAIDAEMLTMAEDARRHAAEQEIPVDEAPQGDADRGHADADGV